MPNVTIRDLPPVTIPIDVTDTFLEVSVLEAGEEVSRRVAADDLQTAIGLDASFVTIGLNAALPNERVITAGTDISLVDGGAGTTVTINFTGIALPTPTVLDSTLRSDGASLWIEETQVRISAAGVLTILDAGLTASRASSHDGTDFNDVYVSTTDWNITGLTAIRPTGAAIQIIMPLNNTPGAPAYSFDDGDTGFYQANSGDTRWSSNGSHRISFVNSGIVGQATGSFGCLNEAATNTNPSLVPDSGDPDTGLGQTTDVLSHIAGAIEGIRLTEVSNFILQMHNSNVGLTADVGSSQGDGPILSSYNVYSIVANAGDAATLPPTFPVGTLVTVKNDGANSMDVFPAVGDDAGDGVNTAVAVGVGESLTFEATVANSTWTQLVGFGATVQLGGTENEMLRWDIPNNRWEASDRCLLSATVPPSAGSGLLTLAQTGSASERQPQLWLPAVGAAVAQYAVEHDAADAGFYLRTRGNVNPARHTWGSYNVLVDTDLFEIDEDLNLNILAGAGFFIGEKVAAVADKATFGQVWVRSDTPNTLVFTDDAGTDFDIAGALAGVVSFEGRFGTVVATIGDYADIAETYTVLETFTAAPAIVISNAVASLGLRETGATADEGNWIVRADGDLFTIATATDAAANTPVADVISITRSGTVVDQFTLGCVLKILEQAAAESSAATFGQFWVRNDAPNTAMFTADDGQDYVLSGRAVFYPMLPIGTSVSDTNAPNSFRFFGGSNARQMELDLTGATQVRFTVQVSIASASVNTPVMIVQFHTVRSVTASDYSPIVAAGELSVSVAAIGDLDTGWQDIAAGAQIESSFVSIFGDGGDGVEDPNVRNAIFMYR